MNGRLCEACQNIGVYNSGHHLDSIFKANSQAQMIRLCYGHSVELWKIGQRNFINKYGENLIDNSFRPEKNSRLKNYFVFSSFS